MGLTTSFVSDEHRKVAKFVVVGVLKTAFAYGLYLLLLWLGVNYNLALCADYAVGITLGYVMNRFWTFADQGQPKAAMPKYLVAYLAVFVLNWAALNLLVEAGMGPALGQIPSLVLATAAAYVLQRYWVFRGE